MSSDLFDLDSLVSSVMTSMEEQSSSFPKLTEEDMYVPHALYFKAVNLLTAVADKHSEGDPSILADTEMRAVVQANEILSALVKMKQLGGY